VKRSKPVFTSAGKRLRALREVQNLECLPPSANVVRLEKAWEEKVGFLNELFF
jgi:hypothetical protein